MPMSKSATRASGKSLNATQVTPRRGFRTRWSVISWLRAEAVAVPFSHSSDLQPAKQGLRTLQAA